jgi:hypothetical protein
MGTGGRPGAPAGGIYSSHRPKGRDRGSVQPVRSGGEDLANRCSDESGALDERTGDAPVRRHNSEGLGTVN